MAETKRFFYEQYKRFANVVSGPQTKSDFQQTGKLTPKEFILAGDALVQKLPAWQWASGPAEVDPYLPPEKKYLILRNCPSYERATTMLDIEGGEMDAGDDWVATHKEHVPKANATQAAVAAQKEINWEDDDEDDAAEDNVGAQVQKCRMYDVTVCYDQYYATPRVYLFGYGEDHTTPLTREQMMEDVYSENRDKTVTIDPHPYNKTQCISIHPCRHAETMKRILQNLEDKFVDSQEDLKPEEKMEFVFPTYFALFVFLKFISSVVPTISYDIAIDLEM